MTDYVAESSVGWLDHSAKDSQRMRELISAFGDRQSIDNLGIGIVRDSISEQLFPGISTIQTRARYFFFIPWFCQRLEGERVRSAEFSRRYRALEIALIDRLVEGRRGQWRDRVPGAGQPQAARHRGVLGWARRLPHPLDRRLGGRLPTRPLQPLPVSKHRSSR